MKGIIGVTGGIVEGRLDLDPGTHWQMEHVAQRCKNTASENPTQGCR